MPRIIAVWAVGLLLPALMLCQGGYGRRRTPGSVNPGSLDTPAVTFQGPLKTLTKKELRIEGDADGQSISFRISKKTHFLKDGKEVKPESVAMGTVVAVDASRDPDLKFTALNVIVNPPKEKPKGSDQ
jgi:hypothetical protein